MHPYKFGSFSEWETARKKDPSLNGYSVNQTRALLGITEGELGEMIISSKLRPSYIYEGKDLQKIVIQKGDVAKVLGKN